MIALDVTESRRAHEHLQQTRERLDTAQRMARVGSLELGRDRRPLAVVGGALPDRRA